MKWLGPILVAAVLAPAALAADPASSGVPVDVAPLNGGKTHGTVTLYAGKGGAAALVDVRELRPRATVRILVQAGTCAAPSASFAALAPLRADRAGALRARGFIRFRGAKLRLRALTADPHAVSVVANGTRVACGELRP